MGRWSNKERVLFPESLFNFDFGLFSGAKKKASRIAKCPVEWKEKERKERSWRGTRFIIEREGRSGRRIDARHGRRVTNFIEFWRIAYIRGSRDGHATRVLLTIRKDTRKKKRYLTYYFQRGCVYVDTFVSNKKKTLFFVKDSRFHSLEKFKIRYASFSYFLNTLHRIGGEVERSAHEETSAQFRRKLYHL